MVRPKSPKISTPAAEKFLKSVNYTIAGDGRLTVSVTKFLITVLRLFKIDLDNLITA